VDLSKCRVLVTGGAGFIGSHLVDRLVSIGSNVVVLDDLSSGSLKNLSSSLGRIEFVKGSLLDSGLVERVVKGCDVVFHLAANPEVRVGSTSPSTHFNQNVLATFNLLEAVRRCGSVKLFVFTSSSTVYGEPSVFPTPEDYAPLKPISVYGASKLACEALISSYSFSFKFRSVIFRLANIVGSRLNHGVIYDFIRKLRVNPRVLEVLGDGSQSKSYLYVDDCIDGMLLGVEKSSGQVEIFNVGSEDKVSVVEIARIFIEALGLRDVELRFTGGVDGGRGWVGDVKQMLLDVSRLKALGWRIRFNSREAVELTAKQLVKEVASLNGL